MKSVWRSRELDRLNSGTPESRVMDLDYPEIINRFLYARGYNSSLEVEKFLSPKLSDLKDPFSLVGMEAAVDRLIQAFQGSEKLCIYADFDLDGTSGCALLYQALRQLGFTNVSYYQPKRLSEGYGFHAKAVEDLHQEGVRLIVTVDVGITAFEACDKAKDLGIDVIITDHHQPSEKLPNATVLINPNHGQCTSGLGYLCGAGVAFYLVRALKRKMLQSQLVSEDSLDLKSLLDFFTIATLTDLVPLMDDNRVLVKHGLFQLEKTKRPGLRALLKALNMQGRPLTSSDVAIRFAPKLNALSRLEKGILPIDLFLVGDEDRAEEMVGTVIDNNSTRVELQESGELEAAELLKDWPEEKFVFVSSKNFHRGVVGLIATKLSQSYKVPAFVGSESEDGMVVGSARIPPGGTQDLLAAMEKAASFLNRFGGHHQAAGFEFHALKKQDIIQRLRKHFSEMEEDRRIPESVYDLDLDFSNITEGLMRWLDALGPFGQSFSAPLFAFGQVTVKAVYNLKGGHRKYTLEGLRPMDALHFSPVGFLPEKGDKVDILGELQWNYYAGNRTMQILVKECRPSFQSTESVVSASYEESQKGH